MSGVAFLATCRKLGRCCLQFGSKYLARNSLRLLFSLGLAFIISLVSLEAFQRAPNTRKATMRSDVRINNENPCQPCQLASTTNHTLTHHVFLNVYCERSQATEVKAL
jgi:hypothetical protein